jgi:hypothetical protein
MSPASHELSAPARTASAMRAVSGQGLELPCGVNSPAKIVFATCAMESSGRHKRGSRRQFACVASEGLLRPPELYPIADSALEA